MSDNVLVKKILDGVFVIEEAFDIVGERIMLLEGVQEKFSSSQTVMQKLTVYEDLFPKFTFQKILDVADTILQKKDSMANSFKEKGDACFQKQKLLKAIRCYNLATAFAPLDCNNAAALLIGRARILLKNEKNAECLRDIETACSLQLTPELRNVILEMKVKCLSLKSGPQFGNEALKDYCHEVMFSLKGKKNSKLQSGSNSIKIICDGDKGRRVVVKKVLNPGTTVMVESPFVMTLNSICEWDFAHCSCCLKKIHAIVPCRKCVLMTYCSEECRKSDLKNGHQYECGCMPFLHSLRPAPFVLMSFKIICKVGPKALYEVFNDSQTHTSSGNNNLEGIKGFDPTTGVYNSDSYYQIMNLATHDNFDEATHKYLSWVAIGLMHALECKTNFFQEIESAEKTEFLIFVASKFVYHCASVPFNTYAIYDYPEAAKSAKEELAKETERVEIGSGLYSLISIMNHGCDPTVSRVNLQNGKMAIITNRRLKIGEELLATYGCTYGMNKLKIRQKEIQQDYRFTCDCRACVFDWPTYEDMGDVVRFICQSCCGTFDHSDRNAAWERIMDESGSCKTCGKKFDVEKMKKEASVVQDILAKAYDLVDSGKMLEAIPFLKESIVFHQTKIVIPNIPLISSQELLRKCHQLIIGATV